MNKVKVVVVGSTGCITGDMEKILAKYGTEVELITIDEAKAKFVNFNESQAISLEIKAPPMIEYPQVIETTLAYERNKEREQWKHRQKQYKK